MRANWKTNHRFLLRAFLLSFMINALIILFFAGQGIYYSYHKLSRPAEAKDKGKIIINKYFETKADFFKMLPNDSNEIVFAGNSLTEGFPLQEMFGNLKIKNRGVGGNETTDVLKRLQEITESKPQKIFLETGLNDLKDGVDIDTAFSNYKKIISFITQQVPDTKLYIQSLFPTAFEWRKYLPQIEEFNKKLKDYCDKNKLVFIDLYPVFYQTDGLDTSLTFDGLHLNGKGYFLWKQQIEKYVNE